VCASAHYYPKRAQCHTRARESTGNCRILPPMGAIETEIKFRVADNLGLENKLASIGFHCVTPRSFESNILYDTPDRRLRLKRELVRIRNYDGHWLLTHKRVPDSGIGEDRHKHRVETETELSDGNALAEVFASVGFVPVFRYEKWRTEWSDDVGHCVIDETPLGVFAELEGTPDWIDRIAHALDVAPQDQMTLSYGRLFEIWKEQTGSQAQDLTFAAVVENPV
jgi:adenylate cyclase class 2